MFPFFKIAQLVRFVFSVPPVATPREPTAPAHRIDSKIPSGIYAVNLRGQLLTYLRGVLIFGICIDNLTDKRYNKENTWRCHHMEILKAVGGILATLGSLAVLILLIALSIAAAIKVLRILYKIITKPDSKEACGYCFDRNIMCYHDEEHAITQQARYCPMCGRKL